MPTTRELLIGCGNARRKNISLTGREDWNDLTTLDIDSRCSPDIVWDLEDFPYPFSESEFDEIHAYEVLEHTGQQGDWRFFFRQWSELYRILKPSGALFGSTPVPTSPWLWGDPGHTRQISKESFVFLSQAEYTRQVGRTHMTDYRAVYHADFDPLFFKDEDATFFFILKAIKPPRAPL